MTSNNPFDDDGSDRLSAPTTGTRTHSPLPRSSAVMIASNSLNESPIWAARHVEWPLPSSISAAQFQKLVKASRQSAQVLGIVYKGSSDKMDDGSAAPRSSKTTDTATTTTTGSFQQIPAQQHSDNLFAGFMNRVLQHPPVVDNNANEPVENAFVRPPRAGCVAAANGWIVAGVDGPPPLRLISRWNVRRGALADQYMALPPPASDDYVRIHHVLVDPTASHTLVSTANGELYYIHSSQQRQQAIKLVGFGPNADGTVPGSMSTPTTKSPAAKQQQQRTGITATSVANRTDEASQRSVQMGVTTGTWITAVAWDKERGTEGSTKKILLGTNAGEIYEYALVAPNSEDASLTPLSPSAVVGGSATSSSNSNTANVAKSYGKVDAAGLPVLLHRLYSTTTGDSTETGAAVTGLYFERLRTGLLVLAATSGRGKRTRFYTFYSPHNSSFRMVLASTHTSLTELPGSVDWADLRVCNDHFGLRTAIGIYFGKIDRTLSGPAALSGGSSMIVDSGIIPYAEDLSDPKHTSAVVPVSLALTPHHIICLSENGSVSFLNRVAQKVIQREQIDVAVVSSSKSGVAAGGGPSGVAAGATSGRSNEQNFMGEFLMDIRRPDQVWLRKGRGLVHISSMQEDRDVWKFTLQKCLDMPISIKPVEQKVSVKSAFDRTFASQTLTDDEKNQEALFDQAKAMCTNNVQKAVVTAIRGEFHVSKGRAELGAKYLAQSPPSLHPFADTAIRLALPKLGIEDSQGSGFSFHARKSLEESNVPLITYLSDTMRVGKMNDDRMTCTMIGAWLTELYLNERADRLTASSLRGQHATREIESSHRAMLAQFLATNVNNMEAKSIMKVLTSHDASAAECASFATKSGDIATAVNAALSVSSKKISGAFDVLRILQEAPFELAEPFYYKHASVLLSRAPTAAGESFLMRYPQGLSPLRLLPAIMQYEKERTERGRAKLLAASSRQGGVEETKMGLEVSIDGPKSSSDGFELRLDTDLSRVSSFVDDSSVVTSYLEGVISLGCRSSAIFNYLISLYTKMEDEEPLYRFLAAHVPAVPSIGEATKRMLSNDRLSPPMDMSYALRSVLRSGRHFRSAIKLYMGFGMRQQAVELALKVDPVLARELAQESTELEERKRLWLMIAKHAASDTNSRGGDVVARVVAVLRDCGPDVISIEDVLPFL
jgi:Pep3/Vps18/deep orange family